MYRRKKKPCMDRCCVSINKNKNWLFGITAAFSLGIAIGSGVQAKHWRDGGAGDANTIIRVAAMAFAILGCVLAIRPWCGPDFNPQRLLAVGFALTSAALIVDGAYYPEVDCDGRKCYDGDPAVAVLCFVELFALLLQICSFCALQKTDLGDVHNADADSLASTDDEYHHDTPGNPYEKLPAGVATDNLTPPFAPAGRLSSPLSGIPDDSPFTSLDRDS